MYSWANGAWIDREEKENVNGGYWKMKVQKHNTVSWLWVVFCIGLCWWLVLGWQAQVWKEVLLAMIGEQLTDYIEKGMILDSCLACMQPSYCHVKIAGHNMWGIQRHSQNLFKQGLPVMDQEYLCLTLLSMYTFRECPWAPLFWHAYGLGININVCHIRISSNKRCSWTSALVKALVKHMCCP